MRFSGPVAVSFVADLSGGVNMLPVKKKSKCRTRTRRAHHALRPVNLVACPKCSKAKLPHAACDQCGYVSSKVLVRLREEGE